MISKKYEREFRSVALTMAAMANKGYCQITPHTLFIAEVEGITIADVAKFSPNSLCRVSRFAKNLKKKGFISDMSDQPGHSHIVGVKSKDWWVNKSNIFEVYGDDELPIFKEKVNKHFNEDNNSIDKLIEGIEDCGLPSSEGVCWEVIGPGKIIITKDGIKKSVFFRAHFGVQRFKKETFLCKEALRAWAESLRPFSCDLEPELVSFVNGTAPSPVHHVNFRSTLTATWSDAKKTLTVNRSTRASCSFSSFDKEEGRLKELTKLGLRKQFDVKGMVPKMQILMNTGKWLPNSVDPYELIFKESGVDREWSEYTRSHMKVTFFCLFFVDSRHKSYHSYLDNHVYEQRKKFQKYADRKINPKYADYWTKEEHEALYNATMRVLGTIMGAEIFFWESLLELRVLARLRAQGKTVVNCYDGFYFDDLEVKEVETIVAEVAMELWGERETKENEIRTGTTGTLPAPGSERNSVTSEEPRANIRRVRERRNVGLERTEGKVEKIKELELALKKLRRQRDRKMSTGKWNDFAAEFGKRERELIDRLKEIA